MIKILTNQWFKNLLVVFVVGALVYYGTYCGKNAENKNLPSFENSDRGMQIDTPLTKSLYDLFGQKFADKCDSLEVEVYKSKVISKSKLKFRMSLINFYTENDSIFNATFLYPVIDSTTKHLGGDTILIDLKISHSVNGKRSEIKYKDVLTKDKP